MQTKVIDNFIDPLLCKAIYANLLKLPMVYDQSSCKEKLEDEKDTRFFLSKMSEYDHVILYLLVKVKEFLNKDLVFLRAYANIQFKDQHSDWHTDDGDCTILLMISQTLKDGKFEIGNHKIDFVQNRCIIFNAKEKHRGLASEYAKLPRCTLAIKTEIINGDN
jgi:hypothetical protein